MKRIIAVILSAVLLFTPLKARGIGVSAKAAVVIDGISGKVLYGREENTPLAMASTTKIMTALLLCEQKDLTRTVTITPEMVKVEGTSMGLYVGLQVSYYDLLYGMLLASGNDAANAVAIAVGGSVQSFVAMMNTRAKELGLNNTHFNTPSGLDGAEHYTTALELAVLTRYALKNKDFADAAGCSSITLEYGGKKHTFVNHNRILREYEGAVGVKTGFTKKAGRCLVTAARKNDGFIIAVTLNDGNDWQDHKAMLDYGFSLLENEPQAFKENKYSVIVLGGEKNRINAYSRKASFKTASGQRITAKEYLSPYVSAPVKKGEKLGVIEYYCGQEIIEKQYVYSAEDVRAVHSVGSFKTLLISFLNMLCYI